LGLRVCGTLGRACGFRLTGLVGQGAIPWASVGLSAFFTAVIAKLLCLNWLIQSSKKEATMVNKTKFQSFAVSMLEVVSGTGASIAASALLA
jgi:hypothetical protein